MKNVKFAQFIFGLAAAVGIIWLSTEAIVFMASISETKAVCRLGPAENQAFLKGHSLLQRENHGIWAYNGLLEKSVFYNIHENIENPSWTETDAVSFRCQSPGTHCFEEKTSGGFEKLQNIYYKDGLFLVAGQFEKGHRIYPATRNPQRKLQLTDPIKFCGKDPDMAPENFFFEAGHLFYFDREQSKVGHWILDSFSGTLTRAAPRAPDEVFQINEITGFEPSSCEATGSFVPAKVAQVGKKLVLMYNSKSGSKLRAYNMAPSLMPSETAPETPHEVDNIWPLSAQDIVFRKGHEQTFGKLNLENLKISSLQVNFPIGLFSQIVDFVSVDERWTFAMSSRRVMSTTRFSLVNEARQLDLPSSELHLLTKKLPTTQVFSGANNNFLWIAEKDDGILFRPFHCEVPQ
jgi:hypothetical protein